jgi:N-glycosylase/DNA lyase
MSEDELWEELCVCILSSNVPYELALSAFQYLRKNNLLSREWIITDPNAAKIIALELSKPIYTPRKKDGSNRKYRFPNVRAFNLVNAAKALYGKKHSLCSILKSNASEREIRDFLAENIPGIGLKEASHFLRNIGYSDSLAIIDTHVIAFLLEVGALQKKNINAVTPSVYLKLEKILQDLCYTMGLNLSILDIAIWRCMRSRSK